MKYMMLLKLNSMERRCKAMTYEVIVDGYNCGTAQLYAEEVKELEKMQGIILIKVTKKEV